MSFGWHQSTKAIAIALAAVIMSLVASPLAAAWKPAGPVRLSLCFKKVAPGDTVTSIFASQRGFSCGRSTAALGSGDFWAVSSRISRSGETALRSGSVWQDHRTVFARYADGVIIQKASDPVAANRSLQLGALFLDRLPARNAPLVQIAWKISGSANLRGIVLGPQMMTIRENGWANLRLAAVFAGFLGLCIALIVHHIALWTAMRHRFQLAYCLMVAILVAYAFTSSGALAWAFPDFDNNDRLRLNYIGLGMSGMAALMFARCFFEARVFAGWTGRMCSIIIGLIAASSLSYAVLAPWQMFWLDKAFSLSFLAMVLFVPFFLWRAWQERSNFLWLFALTWGAPLIFAGLRVANSLHLVDWSFWVDHSTILSMTAEALLSSIAITYRIRMLSIERDEARIQELAARALADTDPLTGLLNRRSFLRRAIGRTGDHVLMIADIDHFKAVNDTIGHDGGDEVLRVVARSLRCSLPADSLVARIGGEEFAILLPADTTINASHILDRLRADRMPFDLTVTASIGTSKGAMLTEVDWKKLYHRADRALLTAKNDGRDRVRHDRVLAA